MLRKVNREQQIEVPLTTGVDAPVSKAQSPNPQLSPLSRLTATTTNSVSQELGRLEILAGQMLSLISASYKITGTAFQSLKRKDLNTDELSIRFGQKNGKEDSIFVTDLHSLSIVRFRFGEISGAKIYLKDDQCCDRLFINVEHAGSGLKATPIRIDDKYIIKVSETAIRIGDIAKKVDYEEIESQLAQKMLGHKGWYEKCSNWVYRNISESLGIKPRPVLEQNDSAVLVNRLNSINRILGETLLELNKR